MQISDAGLEFIASIEKFRSRPYPDQGGVLTIGFGTTRIGNQPVTLGMELNQPVARALLRADVAAMEQAVNSVTTGILVPLKQHQFDALVSLTYNIGAAGFSASTLRAAINEGRLVREDYFTRWSKVTVDGKKVQSNGLFLRRQREFEMFANGVYA